MNNNRREGRRALSGRRLSAAEAPKPPTQHNTTTKNNPMKSYMYILLCSDGTYYTGSTKNLERRLEEHQNGEGANHTKKRLPVELIYVEEFARIDYAFYREKQVQGWSRDKKEALIASDTNLLHQLAECKNGTNYQFYRYKKKS